MKKNHQFVGEKHGIDNLVKNNFVLKFLIPDIKK
jgi:hypothetical protein